jgi:hypothetical protein
MHGDSHTGSRCSARDLILTSEQADGPVDLPNTQVSKASALLGALPYSYSFELLSGADVTIRRYSA